MWFMRNNLSSSVIEVVNKTKSSCLNVDQNNVPSSETNVDLDGSDEIIGDGKRNLTVESVRNGILNLLRIVAISCLKDLTVTNATTHSIRIKEGTQPIKQKERRIAYQYKKEFDQILDDMIAAGKIQPSKSAWASPLRLSRKKDGSLRVTVD